MLLRGIPGGNTDGALLLWRRGAFFVFQRWRVGMSFFRMTNRRKERILIILFLAAVFLLKPVLSASASDLFYSGTVSDGIRAPRRGDYSSASVTCQGLTTSIKGLNEINYRQILMMFARNIPVSLKSGNPYPLMDKSLTDAEKYSTEPSKTFEDSYDAMLCWASAASNMLWLSGYAQEAVNPSTNAVFKNEDEVFDYFRRCFFDFTGETDGAVEYFLKGTYPYAGEKNIAQLREKENLNQGAHMLTITGIVKDENETDDTKKYKGIILADSDNHPVIKQSASKDSPEEKARKAALAPNVYTFYPLSFETVGDANKWVIKNYMDDSDLVTVIKSVCTIRDRPSRQEQVNPGEHEDGGNQPGEEEQPGIGDQTDPDHGEEAVNPPASIGKAPASVKVKVGKNKVTVSWKKIGNTKKNRKLLAQIKGIQVQYSTDPKFGKNVKSERVDKDQTKVVLKLKKKTTYYIRVRYVGKGIVSKWTKAGKVKTRE